jgi:hypothetical protein
MMLGLIDTNHLAILKSPHLHAETKYFPYIGISGTLASINLRVSKLLFLHAILNDSL